MPTEHDPLAAELIRAVELFSEAFAERSIRYALVGGLATMLRGRPRFTQDVDILLEVPQLALPPLLEDLSGRGFTLDPATVRIDWLKPVLPLYVRTLADASDLSWTPGHRLRVASPEGLILTKLVAFREQDQADIATLLAANQATIDLTLIRREWQPYADLEKERTIWLEGAIQRAASPQLPPN